MRHQNHNFCNSSKMIQGRYVCMKNTHPILDIHLQKTPRMYGDAFHVHMIESDPDHFHKDNQHR